MQIVPIDQDHNLFVAHDVFSQDLVNQITATDWLSLPWTRQQGQESWARRRVSTDGLLWHIQWEQECKLLWPKIAQAVGYNLAGYQGTAWWLDEPGFTCGMHTDGEMPGAMQITWIGDAELGTTFYHYKNVNSLRHKFLAVANNAYIMINRPDVTGYRKLQWHAMLTPVGKYRVSSYNWIH